LFAGIITMSQAPSAILLTLPGCAVCPQVRQLLQQLRREGLVHELQEFSLDQHPELAETHQVRSVPWYRIGDYDFSGLQNLQTLRDWALKAASAVDHQKDYWQELIQQGDLETLEHQVSSRAAARYWLWQNLLDPETELQTRLALSVVTEALIMDLNWLQSSRQELLQLANHPDLRLATDGIFYLSISADAALLAQLNDIASGNDSERAEIALEALEDR